MTIASRRGSDGRLGMLARSRQSTGPFEEFYAQTSRPVLRYFARETRDPHRALDLMAETFAKAFEKRRDFRGVSDEQASAWLWAIARAELARFRRSRKIEYAALSRLGLERPAPGDEELREIERMTAAEEVRQHVESALSLLPADQREAVRLRFVEQLSYTQIADQLGVSGEVVRTRTSRALRTLRESDHVHQAVHALEA
jgi:RNA polymerase sigma-70 factor, ECF subfamily